MLPRVDRLPERTNSAHCRVCSGDRTIKEVAWIPVVFRVLLDLWNHPSISCHHGNGISSIDSVCGGRCLSPSRSVRIRAAKRRCMCLAFPAMVFAMALFQMLQDGPHGCQASVRQNGTKGDHFQRSANLKGGFHTGEVASVIEVGLCWSCQGPDGESVQSLLRTPKFLTLNLTLVA